MKYNFIYLLIGIILLVTLVPAWPYQLNLTDGVIYDLNASNNATNNLTIIVVYTNNTYNTTINNTYLNETCYNCSKYITYNYTVEGNETVYNTSQIDEKFLTSSEFSSYKNSLVFPYPSINDFNNLSSRVAIAEEELDKSNSNTGLWIASILGILIACGAVFLIFKLAGDLQ